MKSLLLAVAIAAAVPAHQLKSEGTVKGLGFDGTFTSYHKNGKKQLEYGNKLGAFDGPYREWHENGQLMSEGRYEATSTPGNARKQGTWKLWYASGKPFATIAYKDGLPSGTWIRWYPDGKVWETGAFTDALRVGEWRRYFPDGAPHWIRTYSQDEPGQPAGRQAEWHHDGKQKDLTMFLAPEPWMKGSLRNAIHDFERNDPPIKSPSSWKR